MFKSYSYDTQVVQALPLTEETLSVLSSRCGEYFSSSHVRTMHGMSLVALVSTPTGVMSARKGDYIVEVGPNAFSVVESEPFRNYFVQV